MARSKEEEADTTEDEPKSPARVKRENRGRQIKYMGFSDRRVLNPGERLLGEVDDPLGDRLEWNPGNKHILNTADYPNVKDEFWDRLCQFDDWQDVTKEVNDPDQQPPKNKWEQTWSKEALQSNRLWAPPPTRIDS